MKRGQIAVFLVVLFIAAIGIAAFMSGSGITGMSIFAKRSSVPIPSGNLNAACGMTCMRDYDCSGTCYKCSPSLGRCIDPSKGLSAKYSYESMTRCKYFCNVVAKQCYGGVYALKNMPKCQTDLKRCNDSCTYRLIPTGQSK